MVHRSTTGVSPCESNLILFSMIDVNFSPDILMAANDDGWVISPEQKQLLMREIAVAVQPIFECQVSVDVCGLGNEYAFV